MDNFPCSLNGVYMDVMDELERGESECIRLNKTSENFFMRKLRRNRSDTSVNSSEQSYSSISPEPEHDECFNWELNMNNPSDDTKLEENYKKFAFTHLESSDLKEANTFDYIYLDKNRTSIKPKRRALYHSMSSYNKNINTTSNQHDINKFSKTSIINSHSNLNLNTTSNTTDLNKFSNLNSSKHETILNIL